MTIIGTSNVPNFIVGYQDKIMDKIIETLKEDYALRTSHKRKRRQQREGSKWVYVYFSNETKANYLMQIADALKVNIKIEAI